MAPTNQLFSLVYVSSTVVPLSPSELTDLLATSHRNNSALGITGMLLYKDGNVMQALEGEEGAVRALYAKIGRDPRHRGLLTIYQGPVMARQFQDWSMGFRDLGAPEVLSTPGYSEFLNTPLTGKEFSADPTRSQKLLTTFKKSM
jgi:Sensors of blue-light using FAD